MCWIIIPMQITKTQLAILSYVRNDPNWKENITFYFQKRVEAERELSVEESRARTLQYLQTKWNNTVYVNYNHMNANKNGFKIYTILIDDDDNNSTYSHLMYILMNEICSNMIFSFSTTSSKLKSYMYTFKQKLKSEADLLPRGKLMITFKHNNLFYNQKIITFGDRKCNYKKCSVPQPYQKSQRCTGWLSIGHRTKKCIARYCSRNHQKKDWKQQHRLVCCIHKRRE